MRNVAGAAAIGALGSLTMSGAAVAGGSGATSYSGVFAGHIRYDSCSSQPPWQTTSGTWSVTVQKSSAVAKFTIYTDGQLHVAFTYPGMSLVATGPHDVFAVSGETSAGTLTVRLTDRGTFTYTIAPYHYPSATDPVYVCDSVTYPGHS
jgi:hypothetical protein